MTSHPAEERLFALWGEVADLGYAAGLLGWDQETQMPKRGAAGRGKVLATLAGLRHQRLSSTELADAIAAADDAAEPGSVLAAQAREARRVVDLVARVPERLARELAEAESLGHEAWKSARKASDVALFAEPLRRLVALSREEAAAIADGGRPYDALLGKFEPGVTEAELVPLFEELVGALTPLVEAVRESRVVVDEAPVRGHYPAEKQRAFAVAVAEQMGFAFDAGRLDPAAHPFCSGFGPGDVRLTWRWFEEDFRSALYGVMHEAGHGLYEQGLPEAWQRTPLGNAVSLGVHESQSRLWENLVGRSRAFWEWALPRFREAFPDKRGLDVDTLWPTLHTIKPSFIRVEADEGTYDLHIAVRFELERALFAGDLDVDDLPGAWDDAYERLLGIRPPDAAQGVLQDIHWSMAGFGYFPTYTLGNLIKAQLFRAAARDLGDLDAMIAAGELQPLLGWLREKVHAHGARYPMRELVERATGESLSTADFLDDRRRVAREVYGVTTT